MMNRHIYVHVPFCAHICPYCDFCKVKHQPSLEEAWLAQIHKEMATFESVDTLYIGGGTPSVLSVESLIVLMSHFKQAHEATCEINPESYQVIPLLAKLGINRLSMGVQSFQDELLERMHRQHRFLDIQAAIQLARENGIENISIDLMYGFQGQSLENVKLDLEHFLALKIPHLSIYSLQIEENSIWGKQGLNPINEDLEADMYDLICETLTQAGYQHYEISSFCLPGYESRHNLAYWQDHDFIGYGVGASGKIWPHRYDNTRSLMDYIKKGSQPKMVHNSLHSAAFETLMLGLRTQQGINLLAYEKKYHHSLKEKLAGLPIEVDETHAFIQPEQMALLNSILVELMERYEGEW